MLTFWDSLDRLAAAVVARCRHEHIEYTDTHGASIVGLFRTLFMSPSSSVQTALRSSGSRSCRIRPDGSYTRTEPSCSVSAFTASSARWCSIP